MVHADTYRQHPDISFIVAVVGSHFATNSAVIAAAVHIQIAQACIRHIAGAVAVVDKFFTFYAQGQNFGIAVDVDCAFDIIGGFAIARVKDHVSSIIFDTAIVAEAPKIEIVFRNAAVTAAAAITKGYAAVIFAGRRKSRRR